MTQKQHEALKGAIMLLAKEADLSHRIGIMLKEADEPQLNKHDVSGRSGLFCPACNSTSIRDMPRYRCNSCGDLFGRAK